MVDLDKLDKFLTSDHSSEKCMLLSDLDGFLTGVICSSELIMPSEWLVVAFGDEDLNVPADIIQLVMARYNEIVAGLNSSPLIKSKSTNVVAGVLQKIIQTT